MLPVRSNLSATALLAYMYAASITIANKGRKLTCLVRLLPVEASRSPGDIAEIFVLVLEYCTRE